MKKILCDNINCIHCEETKLNGIICLVCARCDDIKINTWWNKCDGFLDKDEYNKRLEDI